MGAWLTAQTRFQTGSTKGCGAVVLSPEYRVICVDVDIPYHYIRVFCL